MRCLIQETTLLILDEPTSVLTPQEVTALFSTLRQLAKEGCSILFISHKLEEVRSLCHNATVLRQGRVSGDCQPAELSAAEIARMMVGDDTPISTQVSTAEPGDVLLDVRNLNWKSNDPFGTSLDQVNLNLREGEIVGIAGVAGNGQDDLQLTVTWAAPIEVGPARFLIDGYIDWSTAEDDHKSEFQFTPQIKLDVSNFWGEPGVLYAGVEYQYWNNKFGLGDTLIDDQSSVSALVKFHF